MQFVHEMTSEIIIFLIPVFMKPPHSKHSLVSDVIMSDLKLFHVHISEYGL